MITTLIASSIEHYLLYLGIVVAIAGGVTSWIYVPVFGKQLAVCAFALAAAIGSYQLGYNARAEVDKSVELQKELAIVQANLKQAQADLKTNQTIAEASSKREQDEVKTTAELQSKVQAYEDQIAKQDAADTDAPTSPILVPLPANCPKPVVLRQSSCLLTNDDVSGLRGINSGSRGHH